MNEPIVTVEDAIRVIRENVTLPHKCDYLGMLLFAAQTRLKALLPENTVFYFESRGEAGSGKSASTKCAVLLSRGQMLMDPTRAFLKRVYDDNPGLTLGLDEVDVLGESEPLILSVLRYGASWLAMFPRLVMRESKDGEETKDGTVKKDWNAGYFNGGGPKAFNGYASSDKALSSRSWQVDMVRSAEWPVILNYERGFPDVKGALADWLDGRCSAALSKWTPEKVKRHTGSDEFQARVSRAQGLAVRGSHIAFDALLLGDVLGIPMEEAVREYSRGVGIPDAKGEIYAAAVGNALHSLTAEAPVRARAGKSRGSVEVLQTDLWEKTNIHLGAVGEHIGSGAWVHVLNALGFSQRKGGNWRREKRRSPPWNAWRNKHYLIFTPADLERFKRASDEGIGFDTKVVEGDQ
jgi:hypothetical protein